jgi:hypothetical protein
MAKIVLGLATSHTPQLNVPASQWASVFLEKDQTDPRIDYESLLARAVPGLERQLTRERMLEREAACERAIEDLAAILKDSSVDVIVALGDDQHEQFLDDNMPMLCVFYGDTLPMGARGGRQRVDGALSRMSKAYQDVEHHQLAKAHSSYPACPELGLQLISSLMDNEFDIAVSRTLNPEVGLGHAFTFIYRRLAHASIPMVPVMINTFYAPNAAPPDRCYEFGQAVRHAIQSWDSDARVAIVASGGLSHVVIDEELDRALLGAVLTKDADTLRALPVERMKLGTSENRNWIAMAGAMEPFQVHSADYIPCYRTPAGTGCGMGFASWV